MNFLIMNLLTLPFIIHNSVILIRQSMSTVYYRNAYGKIKKILQDQAFVFVYGAQFLGKTEFIRAYFRDYQHVSLKKANFQKLLREDAYRFFSAFEGKTLFADIECCDDFITLFERYSPLYYQQGQAIFLSAINLPEVPESHRVQLLPLSIAEWKQENRFVASLESSILQGGYPETAVRQASATVRKTIETQFRNLLGARDLHLVLALFKSCLAQIDQQLNIKTIAQQVGISAPTAAVWIEKLEQLGLLYLLPAYPFDFGKRANKNPRLYLNDTGLACQLLRINDEKELVLHPQFQALVHNFYLLELRKKNESDSYRIEFAPKKMYYWKESNGHEIKLLRENPTSVDIFEFSSSTEYHSRLRKELDYFDEISNGKVLSKSVIYGGFRNQMYRDVDLVSWQQIGG